MADSVKCPLCDSTSAGIERIRFAEVIKCQTCGKYALGRIAKKWTEEYSAQRYRLSAVAWDADRRSESLYFLWDEPSEGDLRFEPIQISEALQAFPRSLDKLFSRTLLHLAGMSNHMGDPLRLNYAASHPVFFAYNASEARFVAHALADRGWIEARSETMNGDAMIVVTASGWNHAAELEVGLTDVSQAFVAMWFGSAKESVLEQRALDFCTEAYRDGFRVGIETAGYEPVRIDFKEFNDDIMDEVVAEIRRSKFIVADFTGQRSGVYYEAGFARGLGLQVIFTCHESQLGAAHFDTNHMNHIAWKSPEDLARRLEKRIVATVGPGPLKRAQSG